MPLYEPEFGRAPNINYVYIGSRDIVRNCEYHRINGAGNHICDVYCCPGRLRITPKVAGVGPSTVCPFKGNGSPTYPELFAVINE